MEKIEMIVRRILLAATFLIAALAVLEKFLNVAGYTLLRGYYSPSRLLEFSAIGLLFVIVLQLHRIRLSLESKGSK